MLRDIRTPQVEVLQPFQGGQRLDSLIGDCCFTQIEIFKLIIRSQRGQRGVGQVSHGIADFLPAAQMQAF